MTIGITLDHKELGFVTLTVTPTVEYVDEAMNILKDILKTKVIKGDE